MAEIEVPADTPRLIYRPPGPVARAFMKSDAFVRCIRGPFGSGKSVACCVEVVRRSMAQAPDDNGLRRTKWAVIRNTYAELKTTTIQTWRDWFGLEWGDFTMSAPPTHQMKFAMQDNTQVEAEIIFLALDQAKDIKKLLSLELTGGWINEAREASKQVVDAITGRVGRFPSEKDGGATWKGIIMDTNAPSEDHWWAIMSGDVPPPDYMTEEERFLMVRPDNWEFYSQPPAVLEDRNSNGDLVGYTVNPERENAYVEGIGGLKDDYYRNMLTGKSKAWIDVYLRNQYGLLVDGKPVYTSWRAETHISRDPLPFVPGNDILMGWDFGRCPSVIFAQQGVGGRLFVIHELVGVDMGLTLFCPMVRREMARLGIEDWPVRAWGDPAGDNQQEVSEHTAFMILRAHGFNATPAYTNDPVVRVSAVTGLLTRMVDGRPAFVLNDSCKNLKQGFNGGYMYRRRQVNGREQYDDKPDKNRFSHPHDALQYIALGIGEGKRALTGSSKTAKPVIAQQGFEVFSRLRSRTKRSRHNRFSRSI